MTFSLVDTTDFKPMVKMYEIAVECFSFCLFLCRVTMFALKNKNKSVWGVSFSHSTKVHLCVNSLFKCLKLQTMSHLTMIIIVLTGFVTIIWFPVLVVKLPC